MEHLLSSIGLCVIAAAVLAFLAHRFKQPLILAYLVAGMVIGPVGCRLVTGDEAIATVSEIGLILLLFIIGLEIDLKKLKASGKPVFTAGIFQFLLCAVLGVGFFLLLGFRHGAGGPFSALYLALCLGLSSTMIVVKLLYDKFELDTLPGRISLGVLVFQDIWAIVLLAVQPNLLNPQVTVLCWAVAKGALLMLATLLISKYLLPRLFRSVAKSPELVLVASLAWCFAVCAGADAAGLSRGMGALIAGVSISTFPYNMDVMAKVVSIRDFFVTLFFVALGMQIPVPTPYLLLLTLVASLFLIASRLLTVFPLLYGLRLGHRASLLPALNLAQLSEFAIVIAALGQHYGHIDQTVVSLLTLVFAVTSTASTYIIGSSHDIYRAVTGLLSRMGLRDLGEAAEDAAADDGKHIVLLGFFRDASSLLHEFELQETAEGRHPLLDELLVIDFNPQVYAELQRRKIACVYGDVAHMDTLQHAHIQHADLVISTITDAVLRGTDNLRLLQQARRLCPDARVIAAADQISRALELYAAGADFVFLPRLHSARQLAEIIEHGLREGFDHLREQHRAELDARREVLA